jgi:hypothetical protein
MAWGNLAAPGLCYFTAVKVPPTLLALADEVIE